MASAIALLAMGLPAQAQWVNVLGGRFVVNAPAPLGGQKTVYEVANDGSGTAAQWGRAIDSVWLDVPLGKALAGTDSLGCGPVTTALTGKFALVRRGTCSFTEKAANAQAAGAIGVLIANHTAGAGVAGMAYTEGFGTINIPVMMITKELGDSLYAAINAGDDVTISLSRWGFNVPNDLTMVPNAQPLFHAVAIPYKQLQSDNGEPEAYNQYFGSWVANTGTDDQNGLLLRSTITFNPASGGSTVLSDDSISFSGAFEPTDSVAFLMNDASATQLHVDEKGVINVQYHVHGDQEDDYPQDNYSSYNIYATDAMYSKGRIDPATNLPTVVGGYKLSAGTPMVWGATYYVAKGGDSAKFAQFTVSDGVADEHSLEGLPDVNCMLYSWNDADGDGVMQASELNLEGSGTYTFGAADSNYNIFSTQLYEGTGTTGLPPVLKNDTWYWVAFEVPSNYYFGYDDINYYTRLASSEANDAYSGPTMEYWQAQFYGGSVSDASPSDTMRMLPFTAQPADAYSIDSVYFLNSNNVPIATLLTESPVVNVKNTAYNFSSLEMFPNPVQNELNVTVNMKNVAEKVTYRVVDVMGRTMLSGNLYQAKNTSFKINTSYLAAGNYYLIMNDGSNSTSKKFVKAGK